MANKRFFSPSGSRDRLIYQPTFTSSGARILVCVGKESIHDYIQSFKESTDMNVIMKRFLLGDQSVLNVNKGVYANVVGAPKTLAEFLNAQIVSNQLFDKLPADVRSAFGNDVNKFFVTYGSPEWLEALSKYSKTEVNNEPQC